MQAYGIVLTKENENQITLCKAEIVEDFLRRNYEKYLLEYGLSQEELNKCNHDDSLIMKMMPYIKINQENAIFKNVEEYMNFLNIHKDIEVLNVYEGYLY